jgi:hypothetical protein
VAGGVVLAYAGGDLKVAVGGVGRPDGRAAGPAVVGEAREALADDWSEVLYEDAGALACDGEAFLLERAEGLTCGHASDVVAGHEVVFAR